MLEHNAKVVLYQKILTKEFLIVPDFALANDNQFDPMVAKPKPNYQIVFFGFSEMAYANWKPNAKIMNSYQAILELESKTWEYKPSQNGCGDIDRVFVNAL